MHLFIHVDSRKSPQALVAPSETIFEYVNYVMNTHPISYSGTKKCIFLVLLCM